MAVISVHEIWESRSAEWNDEAERRYTRVFRVITDSPNDSALDVINGAGIPQLWSSYAAGGSADPLAFVNKITPRQVDSNNPYVWEVTVEYSSKAGCEDNQEDKKHPDQQSQDPTARPSVVEWGFSIFATAVMETPAGSPAPNKAITNSAGDYFDPPPEIDDVRVTLKITRNEAFFNQTIALDYCNAVNSDKFMGFGPGEVKCIGISGTREYENGKFFWKVSYEFQIKKDKWELRLLDYGYTEVVGGKRKLILDEVNGTPLSAPTLLNGAGQKLPPGMQPVFMTYKPYREQVFASLGLP